MVDAFIPVEVPPNNNTNMKPYTTNVTTNLKICNSSLSAFFHHTDKAVIQTVTIDSKPPQAALSAQAL